MFKSQVGLKKLNCFIINHVLFFFGEVQKIFTEVRCRQQFAEVIVGICEEHELLSVDFNVRSHRNWIDSFLEHNQNHVEDILLYILWITVASQFRDIGWFDTCGSIFCFLKQRQGSLQLNVSYSFLLSNLSLLNQTLLSNLRHFCSLLCGFDVFLIDDYKLFVDFICALFESFFFYCQILSKFVDTISSFSELIEAINNLFLFNFNALNFQRVKVFVELKERQVRLWCDVNSASELSEVLFTNICYHVVHSTHVLDKFVLHFLGAVDVEVPNDFL